MHYTVYYKINGYTRYNTQRCTMRSPFDKEDMRNSYPLYQIAEWHHTDCLISEYTKIPLIIEDCGWEYPTKEKCYAVMEQFRYEKTWNPYMRTCSKFLTIEDAKKELEIVKNRDRIFSGSRIKIKCFPNNRYPNIEADHKFTQKQIEDKMHEFFKSDK